MALHYFCTFLPFFYGYFRKLQIVYFENVIIIGGWNQLLIKKNVKMIKTESGMLKIGLCIALFDVTPDYGIIHNKNIYILSSAVVYFSDAYLVNPQFL